MHPGTPHPSAGPQEVGATRNAFVGICFPANEKELMLSPRNPGRKRNGYHFTFALFTLNQGRVGGRRESDFCPLYFLQQRPLCNLSAPFSAGRLVSQAQGAAKTIFSFVAHNASLHCPGSFPRHSSSPYGESACSAPCTPSKRAPAGGSSQPVGLFRGRHRMRVQTEQGREKGGREIISEHPTFLNAFFKMLLIKG